MSALPLSGRRIVVTRAADQGRELIAALEALGAEAISLPTIAIAPPTDFAPLDRALRAIGNFRGYIFTSANSVRACFSRARALGLDLAPRPGAWICAVGAATATALEQAGWRATIVPRSTSAEGVAAVLQSVPVAGRRIFFPRAATGRELLLEELGRRGASLECVEAYRTVVPDGGERLARELFPLAAPASGAVVDAVVFASPSSVRNLAALLGGDYRRRLSGVALAAIGPTTRAEIEALGLRAAVEAREASTAGIVAALTAHWHARTA